MRFRLLAIVLAVVLAVIGVAAILAYVRQANVRAINGLKTEAVLVATGTIPAGTPLGQARDLLATRKFPVSSLADIGTTVPQVTTLNSTEVITSPMATGVILTAAMLAPAGSVPSAGGLVVPPADGAISLDICVPEDVASYVAPQSTVAVFDIEMSGAAATSATPSCSSSHTVLAQGQANEINAQLELPDVTVLAVTQNTAGQTTSGSTTTVQPQEQTGAATEMLVTFAVTSKQEAEDLMEIQQAGIPYLVLLGSQVSQNKSGL